MTTMLFYETIVPLNRDKHGKLRLRTEPGKADFAARTHYVPLAGTEFYQAARDYPVIFAGGGDAGPVALLGLREAENLFVDSEGRWAQGTYVPAFVRRYPFILAKGDEGQDYTVCVDERYREFSEDDGTALFATDGGDSAYLARTIEFLNNYLAEMEHTRRFVERLDELELLVSHDLRITDGTGRNFLLRDFRIVDEAKLAQLDDAVLGELHRTDYLGWIYAHLVSIGNASRLPLRIVEAAVSAGEGAVEPGEPKEREKKPVHKGKTNKQ